MLPDWLKRAFERELEAARSRRLMHEQAAAEAAADEQKAAAELQRLAGEQVERRPRRAPESRA